MRRALPLLALSACTTEVPAAEIGAELFDSPSLSESSLNTFACSTCHAVDPGAPQITLKAGYDLYGVANRASLWGGDRLVLRDAVDACLVFFMKANPIDPESDDAHALYDYLISVSPADAPDEPLPFTVVENIADVERGDAGRGEEVYDGACRHCHGDVHTGRGSILRKEVLLPEVTEKYAEDFPGVDPSLVVIEKVRHGRFFDIGGEMAPFSLESMSDEDLGALLTYLEL